MPVEWVMDPSRVPMIAVGMNDEPLPRFHGYPARLIVPGLYGYVSATKWLSELELTRFDLFKAYWVPLGWAERAPNLTQARIDVFDCRPGRLEVTLVPKEGQPLELLVDGEVVQRVEAIPADPGYWNGTLYTPAGADGGRCTFELRSAGLVGSTRLAFVRDEA